MNEATPKGIDKNIEMKECPSCGKMNETERSVCKYCAVELVNIWRPYLILRGHPSALRGFGSVYFILSIIGSIVLFANAKTSSYISGGLFRSGEYIHSTNYTFIAMGIASILTSFIVLLICVGIARVMEQNIYIIRHLTED